MIIRKEELKEFVKWIIDSSKKSKKKGSAKGQAPEETLRVSIDQEDVSDDTTTMNVINTIFGGLHTGDSNNEFKKYTRKILKGESVHYMKFTAYADNELAYLYKAINFMKVES